MDITCLKHCLTDDERSVFEKQGFLVVKDALSPGMVADFTKVMDIIQPGLENTIYS